MTCTKPVQTKPHHTEGSWEEVPPRAKEPLDIVAGRKVILLYEHSSRQIYHTPVEGYKFRIDTQHKLDVMEVVGIDVQGHTQLHHKFKVSLKVHLP